MEPGAERQLWGWRFLEKILCLAWADTLGGMWLFLVEKQSKFLDFIRFFKRFFGDVAFYENCVLKEKIAKSLIRNLYGLAASQFISKAPTAHGMAQ